MDKIRVRAEHWQTDGRKTVYKFMDAVPSVCFKLVEYDNSTMQIQKVTEYNSFNPKRKSLTHRADGILQIVYS